MRYLPATDLNAPAELGVLAGLYYDGFSNYLGRGDNSKNNNEMNSTARISMKPSKPGAFMEVTNSETYDNKSAQYLHDHPSLKWYNVTGNSAYSNPNAIKFKSGSFLMLIARRNFTNYTLISKVGEILC